MRLWNPILDADKVLIIEGDLDHADLKFAEKHEYILPAKDKLCILIVFYYHKTYLHVDTSTFMHLEPTNMFIAGNKFSYEYNTWVYNS